MCSRILRQLAGDQFPEQGRGRRGDNQDLRRRDRRKPVSSNDCPNAILVLHIQDMSLDIAASSRFISSSNIHHISI